MSELVPFRYKKKSKGAHRTVNKMIEIANREQATYVLLAERSGVHRETISAWARYNNPRVNDLDAVLGVMGYRLTVERIPDD